jgi:drug/metabolite transporter (DMT)-like permease
VTPADSAGVSTRVSATPSDPWTRRFAELGVLLAVVMWAANFVVVKAAIGVVGPLTFTSVRYAIAAATLLALLRWHSGALRWPGRDAPVLFALGVIGFGVYQVLWTVGLTRITAGNSALLISASPVFVALLAGAVGMDRLTLPKAAGALLAFAGVALVVGAGQDLALGTSLVGDLLTLGAALVWAIYTVGGARILRRIGPLEASAWTVTAAAVVLAPIGIAEAVFVHPPVGFGPAVLVAALYSGAFAAGIANVAIFNAIRYVGPTRVTVLQYLVPALAVVLGAVILLEPVFPAQVVGGAVIIAGVWLTRRATLVPARLLARLSSRS